MSETRGTVYSYLHARRQNLLKPTYLMSAILRLEMSSSTTSNNELKCEECGITFTTIQDKEEHVKLEHEESKRPSGVR